MTAPSSRAADVLERLARDPGPRSAWDRFLGGRRSAAPAPDPDGEGTDRVVRPRRGPSPTRRLPVLLGAACAVLVAIVLVMDRRPPPIEERLPLAAEESTTGSGTPSATPPAANAASGEGDGAGEPPGEETAGAPVFVHVAGAVASPGVVELPSGARVVDAVRAAGGLRADADPDRVNLAAELSDGQRIVVPVLGQLVPQEVLPSGPPPAAGTGTGSGSPTGETGSGPGATPVELNSATAEQLETLPGIGPATAAAIVSHRESTGPFRTVEDLIEVRGIGEAKLDAVRDLVTVGGSG